MELVILDELIQVHGEKFKHDVHMAPERKMIFYLHDVFIISFVLISQLLQNFDFNLPLRMQFLPVLQDFHRNLFLQLMIEAAQANAERPSAQAPLHLIPVIEHFASLIQIIAMDVVVAAIEQFAVVLFAFRVRSCAAAGEVV